MTLSFDFAFEGFRLIRQRPKLILFWGLLSLIGNSAITAILAGMAGPALASLAHMQGQAPDQQTALSLMSRIMPAMMTSLPIYVLMSAVLSAAICRAVGGDSDDRFGFLGFGKRECLLIALEIVMLLLRAVAMTGFLVFGELASQILPGPAGEALLSLFSLAGMGVVLWLSVRLSLNTAQTFDEGRLNIWGSFELSRERFWTLLIGYATAFGLALVVMFLCKQIIDGALVIASGMTSAKGSDALDLSSLPALAAPSSLIYLALSGGVMSPLTASILMGAPISAYRAIRAQRKPLTA